MKKKSLKSVLLLLSIFIFISCNSNIEKKIDKPNFIIFIADDISWDDFGCYGNKDVKTPIIDKLNI